MNKLNIMNKLSQQIKWRGDRGKTSFYNINEVKIYVIKEHKIRNKDEWYFEIVLRINNRQLDISQIWPSNKIGNKSLAEILYNNRRKIIGWILD